MVEKSHTAGAWPNLYEPLRNFGQKMADWLAPASEASTTDDSYKISLELPGVEEKDIDISVHDGVVVVKGEKSSQKEEKGETWFFSERQYGSFSRSFRLPEDADGNKVEAHLKDGVLQVIVPKVGPEAKQGTKVKINKG
ncbi:Spore protein SP21 [Thalassovita gelatinovora]|uniref:Spore protein SP21 n=1 Tax=Thalassovita gelatinovora TaxID=53501 RepID=A0A0P1F5K6_THAGE|nr:Hsp20/alpha crystallin family protein [Thalassovita gelatinovora]QIZ80130.1 Hsp20/alpha crystallin family protein [Thalassovita gelatinovora]CUH63127.1 Spore protein SP21 [Thalassovita gelatinovora]SER20984.1 heat shock protein Hsp20 [Thalassovita gelatinovora]